MPTLKLQPFLFIACSLPAAPLPAQQPTAGQLMVILERLCTPDYPPCYLKTETTSQWTDAGPTAEPSPPARNVHEYFFDEHRFAVRSNKFGPSIERLASLRHFIWDGKTASTRDEDFPTRDLNTTDTARRPDLQRNFRDGKFLTFIVDDSKRHADYASRFGRWRMPYWSGQSFDGLTLVVESDQQARETTIFEELRASSSGLDIDREALDPDGRPAISLTGGRSDRTWTAWISRNQPHELLGWMVVEESEEWSVEKSSVVLERRMIDDFNFAVRGRMSSIHQDSEGKLTGTYVCEISNLEIIFNPDFDATGAFEMDIPEGALVMKKPEMKYRIWSQGRLDPPAPRGRPWAVQKTPVICHRSIADRFRSVFMRRRSLILFNFPLLLVPSPLSADQPTNGQLMVILERLCNVDYRPYYLKSEVRMPQGGFLGIPEGENQSSIWEFFLDGERYGYRFSDHWSGFRNREDGEGLDLTSQRWKSQHFFWDGVNACNRNEYYRIENGIRGESQVAFIIDEGKSRDSYASRHRGWRGTYYTVGHFMDGYIRGEDSTLYHELNRSSSGIQVDRDATDHEGRPAIAIRGGKGDHSHVAFISRSSPHKLLGWTRFSNLPEKRIERRFSILDRSEVDGILFPVHGRVWIHRQEAGEQATVTEFDVKILEVQFNPDFDSLGAFDLKIPEGALVLMEATREWRSMRNGRLIPAALQDSPRVSADVSPSSPPSTEE